MGPKRTSFFGGWDTSFLASKNHGSESTRSANQESRPASRTKSHAKRDLRRGPGSSDVGERQGGQHMCFSSHERNPCSWTVLAGSKTDRLARKHRAQTGPHRLQARPPGEPCVRARMDSELQHRAVGFVVGSLFADARKCTCFRVRRCLVSQSHSCQTGEPPCIRK